MIVPSTLLSFHPPSLSPFLPFVIPFYHPLPLSILLYLSFFITFDFYSPFVLLLHYVQCPSDLLYVVREGVLRVVAGLNVTGGRGRVFSFEPLLFVLPLSVKARQVRPPALENGFSSHPSWSLTPQLV